MTAKFYVKQQKLPGHPFLLLTKETMKLDQV